MIVSPAEGRVDGGPPRPGAAARALLGAVRAYRLLLSPWLGNACRFEPTCSCYAMEAIERHGAAVGSGLAVRRVLRCHPFCAGGVDPVPPRAASSTPISTSSFTTRRGPLPAAPAHDRIEPR